MRLHKTQLALASCLKRLPEKLLDPESYIGNLIGTDRHDSCPALSRTQKRYRNFQ